ncbi:hypothetical protein VCRA2113O415_50204 [Vibrio crassostreae]|nr:hypothetical protein VCRA2111O408_70084 [Vibrio crassostreae]CAK2375495.1 hypothetical protein VCRA211O406_70084 [Vibrio crassostreae]CAK2525329.1 hypothetical protein VCRA2113O415_50204 [Vibrio crassostreae]CAK3383450.1 hypothetical protein VCRA2121O436_20303 [Vibrio crassostreae]CAK3478482.1 hypothetical protein VCRA2123O443_70084 [Vibrio crassostreae]
MHTFRLVPTVSTMFTTMKEIVSYSFQESDYYAECIITALSPYRFPY